MQHFGLNFASDIPMKWVKCCLFGLVALTLSCHASQWFVATNGSGNGSFTSPWSLASALTNSAIQPGDTVWLRGGTYFPTTTCLSYSNIVLVWVPTVAGTSNNLITYRSYSNEWAAIDREWIGAPSYVCFRDLEFYDSLKGHNLTNNVYPHGPWAQFPGGIGDQWVNCVIHDVDNCWAANPNSAYQVRGCILWYVGWNQWEHVCYPAGSVFSGNIVGWYIQNCINNTAANLLCVSNIMFGGGINIETSTDINISPDYHNHTVAYNCLYNRLNNGSPCGGIIATATATNNLVINSNVTVAPNALGLSGAGNGVSVQGNTVYASSPKYAAAVLGWNGSGIWTIDYNSYFAAAPNPVRFYTGGNYYTFPQWQSLTGFDSHSGATNSANPPDAVYVIPNQDQAKRCHIAVYSWSSKDNVTVDLSNVLNSGDTYKLYSAQNYLAGPIQTGTFNGTNISVPMTNLTSAPMLYGTNINASGEAMIQPQPTSPEFGAFVVIGSSGSLGGASLTPPPNFHIVYSP